VHGEYLAAVTAWDGDAIMGVFGSPCYVEFGPQRIDDRERIRTLYEWFFGDEIKLIFSTITDDGETLVVEWATPGEERAGGLTAYKRDARGRIGSIHMYDNFDPSNVPGVMESPRPA
jgi:YD repeat-containing protein